jgi:hypothetical protein
MLSVLSLPAVSADFCAKTTVLSTTDESGTRVGLVVVKEDFAASPPWQPGKAPIPLSLEKALDIAVKANQGSRATSPENISLSSHTCNRSPRYWFYIFTFEEPTADHSAAPKSSTIGVLLSGKVVRMTKLTDGI